jgi:hypothetical protein
MQLALALPVKMLKIIASGEKQDAAYGGYLVSKIAHKYFE